LFYEPFSFIFYFFRAFPHFSTFFRTFPLAGQFVVYGSGDFRVCLLAECGDGRRKARGRERTMPRQRLRCVQLASAVFIYADCVSFIHKRLSHNWGREGKCCIGCIGCIGSFLRLGISPGHLRAQGSQKPASPIQARSPSVVSAAKLSTATRLRRETARSRSDSGALPRNHAGWIGARAICRPGARAILPSWPSRRGCAGRRLSRSRRSPLACIWARPGALRHGCTLGYGWPRRQTQTKAVCKCEEKRTKLWFDPVERREKTLAEQALDEGSNYRLWLFRKNKGGHPLYFTDRAKIASRSIRFWS